MDSTRRIKKTFWRRPSCKLSRPWQLVGALFVIVSPVHGLDDWPQFRGPDGQGHSDAEGVALHWNESRSIVWKTPIPGKGWSSPVVSGQQIWLTSATEEGRSLRAIAIDRNTGQLLHNVEVFRPVEPGSCHTQNGYASPTPVVDGKHVFVHFGPRGTACLDFDGKIVWTNTTLEFAALQGAASSPIVCGDRLIICCDGTDKQFVVALNKRTGEIQWRRDRDHLEQARKKSPISAMAYSTPLVIDVDGVAQLVSTSADHVAAYSPVTGDEIWWMPYEGFSLVARPSFGNGLVYVVGSITLDHHAVYAIRPGNGQIQDEQLVWQCSVGIPHVPSPLLVGEELFVVHDGGIATCFDAISGKVNWKERLPGSYRASPVEVRGRLYVCSQEGSTYILEAGKEFKLLATNQLDGTFFASPAVAGKALYLRSDEYLYRIEDRKDAPTSRPVFTRTNRRLSNRTATSHNHDENNE